jgi:site-specific DNA recombinase
MNKLDVVWDELFPQEQVRIVNLLMERVVVSPHDVEVQLRANGFRKVIQEIDRKNSEARESA